MTTFKRRLYFTSEIHFISVVFISLHSCQRPWSYKLRPLNEHLGLEYKIALKFTALCTSLIFYRCISDFSSGMFIFKELGSKKPFRWNCSTVTEQWWSTQECLTIQCQLSSEIEHFWNLSSVEVIDTICTEGLGMVTMKWGEKKAFEITHILRSDLLLLPVKLKIVR